MRFEGVLPKMRDEGRIGKVGGMFFKFENGFLWRKTSECSPWSHFPRIVEDYLTIDTWSLEPIKVKKSCWSFGTGPRLLSQMLDPCTDDEATKMRVEQGFEWKEEIVNTRIYEEES